MTTNPHLTQAHAELDLWGSVVANGADITGDLSMRTIMAFRSILNRHQPVDLGHATRCIPCDVTWPCPDASDVLKVLAVDPNGDDA